MVDLTLAQALFDGSSSGPTLRTRAPNFADEWLPEAEALCAAFGTPPPGVECPAALFAAPLGGQHVAVVQVAGPPEGTWDRRPAGHFRFLVLARELYKHLGDPFAVADRYPPPWDARNELLPLEWPPEPLPPRTVGQLQEVLKHGDGPFLLGATQALVDGSRIVLQRPAPAEQTLRDLWALLPASTRSHLWPATFAFGEPTRFDVAAVPQIPEGGLPGFLTEEMVLDYPDSRYERHLQIAIESGDQRELDRLLSRRSSAETLRLALYLLGAALVVSLVMRILTGAPPPG